MKPDGIVMNRIANSQQMDHEKYICFSYTELERVERLHAVLTLYEHLGDMVNMLVYIKLYDLMTYFKHS